MKKISFIISVLLVILLFTNVSYAQENNFKVIVNDTNPDTVLTRETLSKMFLKKVKRWEKMDEKILPVDLLEDSLIREDFTEKILGKKISSVKAFWQKQIFSGRGVPPPEKKNETDVLEYVHENKGAIGYISKNKNTNKYDVTIVEITEE